MTTDLVLFRDLAIIWLSAMLAGFICLRLKQPLIAGYIIAGISIGPYAIKLIQHSEQISTLAELGVALLLFAIGVEVPIRQLFSSAGRVILSAICQIVGTTLLGWCVVTSLGLAPGPLSGILFGFICALSSTVVVTKILSDRFETEAIHGRILIPTLVVQDLCLVPVVALLPAMHQADGGADTAILMALAKAVLLIVLVSITATRLVPPLLAWVSKSNNKEIFLLTMISLCLGIAILSKTMGLSLALGAFLGGLIVSDSPYAHEALSEMSSLRDLFSTVFFVSVGMLLDPAFIASNWAAVLGFVVALIVGKALIGGFSALIATRSVWSATLVGVGLAQIGEFSFVVASVGHDSGLINDALYNLFFAGAVVTLIASPGLMNLAPMVMRRMALRGSDDERVARHASAHTPIGLKDHVVLCGFGRIGRNVGLALSSKQIPFVVIELDGGIIQELLDSGVPCVFGDSLSKAVLHKANLKEASCLVLTVPEPIATVTIIGFARKINPEIKIIARVHRPQDVDLFKEIGANAVVQPEFECSVEIARLVLSSLNKPLSEINEILNELRRKRHRQFQPDIAEPLLTRIFGFPHDDYLGVWFKVNQSSHGKTITDLDFRKITGASIIAMRRQSELIPHPDPDERFRPDDEIYVVGNAQQLKHAEDMFDLSRFCPLGADGKSEDDLITTDA